MTPARHASAYAHQPAYAAGQFARPYDVPGAATRTARGVQKRGALIPALYFFGGMAAGAGMAVVIARALLK